MKRRKTAPRKKRPRLPEVQESLSETSRALYGIADPDEPDALQPEAESIEDPLEDWPEAAGEADSWLRSRRARRDEEREG
jgi:hypothetical protein